MRLLAEKVRPRLLTGTPIAQEGVKAMTEAEWLACTDPAPMLDYLRRKASDRKLRLFAVACCRRIWHLLVAEVEIWHKDEAAFWQRCQDAVLLAERFADGEATTDELVAVTAYPRPALYDADAAMFTAEVRLDPLLVSSEAAEAAGQEAAGRVYARFFPDGYAPTPDHAALMAEMTEQQEQEYARVIAVEQSSQCGLLRDVFGNAFRPIATDPGWLPPHVVGLARGIYDDRAFNQMMELADALEEAGCQDEGILAHCRGTGPHVRGCWVVDLILGKE
jgi:hypothetical protein